MTMFSTILCHVHGLTSQAIAIRPVGLFPAKAQQAICSIKYHVPLCSVTVIYGTIAMLVGHSQQLHLASQCYWSWLGSASAWAVYHLQAESTVRELAAQAHRICCLIAHEVTAAESQHSAPFVQ